MSLTFSLTKGLLYGLFVGMMFGIGVYLVATAVVGMGWLAMTPVALAALVFANGVMGGVGHEYGVWLRNTHSGGLMFGLTLGLLDGVTMGLYFGIGIYLMGLIVVGMGWLIGMTAIQLASLTFAVCVLMMITYQYAVWYDAQQKLQGTTLAPSGTGPPAATP
jgi:hypothetical protein